MSSGREELEDAESSGPGQKPDLEPNPSPNLFLIYSLIALALATAIGLALLVVMPFYHRR